MPILSHRLPDFSRQVTAASTPSPERIEGLTALRSRLPQVDVQFDPVTGAPSSILSVGRFLTPEAAHGGDAFAPVRQFVNDNTALFGHDATALASSKITRDDVTAHNGMRTVVWQQQIDGIPVYNTIFKANLTKDGAIVAAGSSFMADAPAATQMTAAQRAALVAQPPLDGPAALSSAAKNIGVPVAAAQVGFAAQPAGAEKKQNLTAAGLSDVVAKLSWLPMNATSARLTWDVTLMSTQQKTMYQVLVDAQTGEVLLRRSLTADISNASYRVYADGTTLQPFDSPAPMSPGLATPTSAQAPALSRTLITTAALDTTASPNGWIDDGGTQTYGNNVDAHLDTGSANPTYGNGTHAVSATRNFDFTLDLSQDPTTYQSAVITSLFYACNYYHDKLYALGFTESAGNFQQTNFGKGGLGNDAVLADAQDGSGTNNANFSTPADGSPGRMQMYIFTGPAPHRDGDLDMEIVFHEHTHGLSNRLVGGGVGISALQTGGMGEGWSDFYGLCLLSQPTDDVNGTYAAGAYATYQFSGLTSNYYYGIRRYPYCTDMTKNPLTLKDIDPGKASAHTGVPCSPIFSPPNVNSSEVHNQGEVWCVTLWDVRANLINKLGAAAGNQMVLRLVTDGMKLSPANPTFLQARDAIIQADLVDNGAANKNELWAAFAKRGMGSSATVPASSTTTGVVEAFDIPDNLGITPATPLTSNGQIGGPFSPASQTYTLTNNGTGSLNWTAAANQGWLSLSTTSGTLAPGASTPVTVTINSNANNLVAGSYSATTSFTDVTSGAVIARQATLSVTPPRVAYFDLSTDPGWARQGEWAYGTPTGAGGATNGYHDPTSGATGSNVFGINLNGDYTTSIGGPYYLTTGAINLANYSGTQLRFKRWLNTDYPSYVYATVQVSNDGTNWTTVFTNTSGSFITDSAWTAVQYDISAVADKHSTVYIRWGHQVASNGAIALSGWNIDDIEIVGTPAQGFGLSLASNNVTEGSAPITATLSISPVQSTAITVTLSSSDPTSATVPANVTIPAGQSSVTFPVTILNDAVVNGTRSITLSATATNFTAGAAVLTVNDDEAATLTVAAPASVSEGAGTVQGTVTISTAPANAVAVSLSSSDTATLQVPATVTIPAGQTSATYPITIINDSKINGPHSATITAHVTNWTDGTASVVVQDNESTALTLTLPASVNEGGATTGTVSLSGTLSSPLTVSFSSSNTARLSPPSAVTIPAGSTSATFSLVAPNNSLTDGTAVITVTASAAGFTDGNGTINVLDNDVDHYTVSAIASQQIRGAPFTVTVTAKDVNGATIGAYTGTATLSASGDGGAESISPTTTAAFSSGVWTGSVTVNSFDTNVVLTVSDGAGHVGTSSAFDVSTGALHHFSWNTVGTPQSKNVPFGVTVTARDAGNNPVTNYNGTANLSGIASAGSGSSIVITELAPNGADEIEFMNVSSAPVDISGWTVHIYDDVSWPSPLTVFTIPAGTTCAAGQIFRLQEYGTAPGTFPQFYYGNNISWDPLTTSHVAVMLRNASGAVIDFVAVGAATPSSITSPVTVAASQWSGATVTATTSSTADYNRIGTSDTNQASDWVVAAAPSLGTLNPGLTVPFPGSTTPLSISPTVTGNFVGGVWSGNVTALQGATQMKLRADDGAGHTGDSNAFDVLGNPPTATTAAASSVSTTGATLNGVINANGASTVVSFDYGLTTSYGNTITAAPSPVAGTSATNVSAVLSGLPQGVTYHFRVNATSAYGTTVGNDLTFTTTNNNADLSNLVLSAGTLTPAFASSITSYTASVGYSTASLTVTPTVAAGGTTVKVNGVTVASGSTSGAISLAVGSNTITTVVTASDGTTTKTYSVVVMRSAASTNANLSNLALSAGTLSPVFASSTTSYTVSVSNSTTSTTVTPIAADSTATIKINGVTVPSGTPSAAISLAVGSTTITAAVTAQDGVTTKTYTVVVTRSGTMTGFISTGSLNAARYSQGTVLLGNGKVLVAGGTDGINAMSTAEVYDPSTGIWTYTGSLITARYQPTATLLPNGKVLIVGGFGTSGVLSSAELYNPATGTWTATGSLHAAHQLDIAVLLPNGKVLVAGGYLGGAISSAELYDPATGIWTVINSMNTARYSAAAALLPNGKVLVAGGIGTGGSSLTSSEIYDPATGSWTSTTGAMSTARSNHTLSPLPDGTVLAAGGYSTGDTTSAELFNPATGTWTATGSMSTARSFHTASLLPNGKVLVTGGFNIRTAELYDYATGTWTPTSSMTALRSHHATTILPSGRVLVVGGSGTLTELYDYSAGAWANTSSLSAAHQYHQIYLLPNGKALVAGNFSGTICELYDSTAGTWTTTGSLSTARSQCAGAMLANGTALIAGGYNGGHLSSCEIYNPSTGTWSATGSLATPRLAHTGTLLANGKVLVAGGQPFGSTTTYNSCELYNPATGTWTPTGSMINGRDNHVAVLLANGKVLVAGGISNGSVTNSAEIYDPSTGTWTVTASMSMVRNNFTATLLPNGKVIVTGGLAPGGATATAEIYNPATGTWSSAGSMSGPHYLHTATLLPNGKVLVASGQMGSGVVLTCELYDPATNTWSVTGNVNTARAAGAATLLTNGKVLLTGGSGTTSCELYDPGLGYATGWQPQISSATSPLTSGASLILNGSGFTGISGASSGSFLDSSTNYPVVQLMSLQNGQSTFLLSNATTNWSATSFTSSAVNGFPIGYALATVFTNGIPSNSALVVVTPSSNANLSNLTVSAGSLSPVFSSGITNYTDSVANATNSITLTATTADSNASVKVNGVAVTSGSPSSPFTLNVGANTINIVVTAQDGTTTKTYSIVVTRAASSNASLANLTLSSGTLTPVFAAGTTSYTANVSDTTTSITVTPTVADATATLKINNVSASPGVPSTAIVLSSGPNTVTVVVTAQDGITTSTYTTIVTRLTNLQTWRLAHFGTPDNIGNAADNADFDHDRVANLVEYAFGLDPTSAASLALPQPVLNGNTLSITFNEPPGVFGITYGAEWSPSPLSGNWAPVPDTGSGSTHVFSITIDGQPAGYLRLKVSAP